MNAIIPKLPKPPIVEAVLDIDCDMQPKFDLPSLEKSAAEIFRDAYSVVQTIFLESIRVPHPDGGPATQSATRDIHSLQFLQEDRKQLVQIRAQGYSFNRLAPYSGLDDYLPEIHRTWRQFVRLAAPIQVRGVRLRYINRILLPLNDGNLDVSRYLKMSPQLPHESNLTFMGFLNQTSALEVATGNVANITLATLPPENDKIPLIFDNAVAHPGPVDVDNWPAIAETIQSLRTLKNRIFTNTLTESCLSLFQQSE